MEALADALPVVAPGDGERAGRIDVRDRVLEKVARATGAELIGVPWADVSARVSDIGRGLAVQLSAPLPVPDLGDAEAVATAVPVLERARLLQREMRSRLALLLGREVVRVEITIDGAVVEMRRRVR